MQAWTKQTGTWKWGMLCLVFLAPFFFLTYGFANQYAAGLDEVRFIVFDWETHIPLWPWTIVPYWSIDLFYGLSLLLCWNLFELKQHVLRLLSAQIISIACFLLFPLKFTFERPELSGFFGIWFDVLMGFDKPFNQAPSLHIVLLVILWDFYRRHVSDQFKYVVDLWSLLIGISVLTTWQHHFIDIPTGILVGALCLWLFPVEVQSPFSKDLTHRLTPKHLKLGAYYLTATAILCVTAIIFESAFLWLLYPVCSLLMVSLAYFFTRAHFFQKLSNGKLSAGAKIILAPYLMLAWLNSRLWTHKHPEDSRIITIDGCQIYLGRIPTSADLIHYQAIFDCCAELPRPTLKAKQQQIIAQQYYSLDLIPLQANQLAQAVENFDQLFSALDSNNAQTSKILIFCALGYSRSSAILCAWLVKNAYVDTMPNAISLVQQARPWIILKDVQIQQLNLYMLKLKGLAP